MATGEELHRVVKSTRDPSCMTRWKAKGCSSGLMVAFSSAPSRMAGKVAKEPTCGQMVRYMKANSRVMSALA